jgi:hypothetical protein
VKSRRFYITGAGGNAGTLATMSRTAHNATTLDRMIHHFGALGYVIASVACAPYVADLLQLAVDPSDPTVRLTPEGHRVTCHAGVGRCDRRDPAEPCTIDDVTHGASCATCAVNAVADVRGRLRDIRACSARCRGWRVAEHTWALNGELVSGPTLVPCRACSLDVPVLRRVTRAQIALLPEARAALEHAKTRAGAKP